MKKIYVAPKTAVINMKPTSIVCSSIGISDTSKDNDNALSRGYDWDDEDDD